MGDPVVIVIEDWAGTLLAALALAVAVASLLHRRRTIRQLQRRLADYESRSWWRLVSALPPRQDGQASSPRRGEGTSPAG